MDIINSSSSRRTFLKSSFLTAAALSLPRWAWSQITATNVVASTPLRLPPLTKHALAPGKTQLPDWMRVPRWYTRDPNARRAPTAGETRELIQTVAANGGASLRLGSFLYGEAFYQSNVAPHTPGLGDVDVLSEAVEEGTRLDVKVVAYMNPNTLHQRDPLFESCVMRDADGNIPVQTPYRVSDTRFTCITNPIYRKFLADVLTEMFTKYQPDALYVDGLSPHLCFCEYCRRRYQKSYGRPMPVEKFRHIPATWTVWAELDSDPQPVGDVENDPDARRLTDMLYQSLGEVTHLFRQTVKAAKPGALTMFHSHPKPNCADCYDATLTEVFSPRPWVHIAWQTGEMAGYSSVFHVPVLFNIYNSRHRTADSARWLSYQVLANGAYPNFWQPPGMKDVMDFMDRNAEYLDFATTSPTRFLALARDFHLTTTQSHAPLPPGVTYRQDRFLAPYVGAYSALMRPGLPVVTVHRPHFEESLEGFRVLCLANVALMSDSQAAAVRRFVHHGGGLIATHETSLYDEKGRRRDDFALANLFGVHYRAVLPAGPRVIHFGENPMAEGVKDIPHPEPLVAANAGAGSVAAWFQVEATDSAATSGTNSIPASVAAPPQADQASAPAIPTPAVVTHSFGRGRVVYLPGRLDAMQCATLSPDTERLFFNATQWLVNGELPVRLQASGTVGVSLYQQSGRFLVHLLNYQRDSLDHSENYQPIQDLAVQVQLPPGGRAAGVRSLWTGQTLSCEQRGATAYIRLPTLDEYEVLAVDWQSS